MSNTTALSNPGSPAGWNVPSPPDNWEYKKNENVDNEPDFDDVDNPGDWDYFSYKQVYVDEKINKKKTGRKLYSHHELPTKCRPVPADDDGQRKIKEWTFHYDGFKVPEDESYRHGATKEDMFPESRSGSLDAELLAALGLDINRMKQKDGAPDALFSTNYVFPFTKRVVYCRTNGSHSTLTWHHAPRFMLDKWRSE